MIGNDLRINGGLENSPGIFQFMAQLGRVYQISIVGQSQSAFYIVKNQRLGIFPGAAPCCGVSHMAHPDVAMKLL